MGSGDVIEDVIVTEWLDLHHIGAADIITLYDNPEDTSIYINQPYKNTHRVLMDESGPLRWRIPQVKNDPSTNKWFVRWIVLRDSGVIIGNTNFHGPPDNNGMIEIGIEIDPLYQRRGFGTEALLGMWMWASTQSDVRVLRYTVSPTNGASVAVIKKLKFSHVGQQIDDVDGPEDIYEMTMDQFLHEYVNQ